MNVIYLKTSTFTSSILKHLTKTPYHPILIITRPNHPKNHGLKLAPPPVADKTRELGIDVDQPQSVNSEEAIARIAAADPDVVVVCAFGALIKEPLLSTWEM